MHSVVAAICNPRCSMHAVKDAFAVDDMNFVYFLKFLLCGCALLDVWLLLTISAAANKFVNNKMTKDGACVIQTVFLWTKLP